MANDMHYIIYAIRYDIVYTIYDICYMIADG